MTSLLYLASVDLPHRKARAIQIVNTAHALARSGVDVTLVGGRRGPARTSRVLSPYGLTPHARLRILRPPVLRLPRCLERWYTRIWQLSYLLGLLALMPSLFRRGLPDAILVRDLRLAWLLCRFGRAIRQRLIYEVHDLSSLEAELKGDHLEGARLKKSEEVVFARVPRVICITSELKRLIAERHGRHPETMAVIPDGTNAQLGPCDDSSSRNGVYYVGQLYAWKGVDTLIHAAAEYQSTEYVIVGGTEEPGAEDRDANRLIELSKQLGVQDRVKFTGWVPYRRIPEILRDAAVTVIPLPDTPFGRYFTSPLKLFDYMAAGVPIVASDLPSLRDVLHDEVNALLVQPNDPMAMAAAIARLHCEPELAKRLGRQARYDVQRYTWNARAAQINAYITQPNARQQ
ncbi:MAG: glycosyltransferase family 4 protein [Chloroflexota bacterium]